MAVEPRLSEVGLRILAVLLHHRSETPLCGTDLLSLTGASAGTVYPLLDRLLSQGWVRFERETGAPAQLGRPPRNFWWLTEEGRQQAEVRIGFLSGSAACEADMRTLAGVLDHHHPAGEADTSELARTLDWSSLKVHLVAGAMAARGLVDVSRDGNESVWQLTVAGERWLARANERTAVAPEASPTAGVSVEAPRRVPSPAQIEAARDLIGMGLGQLVTIFDEDESSVRARELRSALRTLAPIAPWVEQTQQLDIWAEELAVLALGGEY